jgi:hypothetical protein
VGWAWLMGQGQMFFFFNLNEFANSGFSLKFQIQIKFIFDWFKTSGSNSFL